MAFRKILVAVNGTRNSEIALQKALEIARSRDARLVVLGVEEKSPPYRTDGASAHRNGELHAAVEAAVQTAREAGVNVSGEVQDGYPPEAIIQYSKDEGCDLIVVGACDPASGVVGPTADKVVDLAACEVMVAR